MFCTAGRFFTALSLLAGVAAVSCGVSPAIPSAARTPSARGVGRVGSEPPEAADRGLSIAELGTCALDSGQTIENCRVGYRTFGTLDAAKSNAVLFPTWFTGTTKALTTRVPERLVDTSRFFVILVDSLGNGVSSSPSNSKTQPRLRFPRFTIHDMVESQRRLVREVLGIEKLHTVMGVSMGGMQAFEWAVAHPDEVARIVPIVGSPQLTAQDLLLWNAELHLLDDSRAYAKGEYAERPKIPALQELHWLMLSTPAQRNAETSRAAYAEWIRPKADDVGFDWNDWHRQLEAMLSHDVARAYGGDLGVAASHVKAKALVVVGDRDLMVNAEPAKTFAKAMHATLLAFDDPCGHGLQGCEPQLPETIRAFMGP